MAIPADIKNFWLFLYASEIIYPISIVLVRFSILLFLYRFFHIPQFRLYASMIGITVGAWGVATVRKHKKRTSLIMHTDRDCVAARCSLHLQSNRRLLEYNDTAQKLHRHATLLPRHPNSKYHPRPRNHDAPPSLSLEPPHHPLSKDCTFWNFHPRWLRDRSRWPSPRNNRRTSNLHRLHL